MAIIKAVNSRASIGNVIRYITKPVKTEERLIGTFNCRKNNILGDMRATKKFRTFACVKSGLTPVGRLSDSPWNKTGGRQYKHFIQSFSPDENISSEEAQ